MSIAAIVGGHLDILQAALTAKDKRIEELEDFLKQKLAIAYVSADNKNHYVPITIKEIEQALAPKGDKPKCELCGGSREVPRILIEIHSNPYWGMKKPAPSAERITNESY